MRNRTPLLIAVPLFALLAGCGAKAEDAATNVAPVAPAPTASSAPAAGPSSTAMSPPPAANPDQSAGGTAVNANELGPQ